MLGDGGTSTSTSSNGVGAATAARARRVWRSPPARCVPAVTVVDAAPDEPTTTPSPTAPIDDARRSPTTTTTAPPRPTPTTTLPAAAAADDHRRVGAGRTRRRHPDRQPRRRSSPPPPRARVSTVVQQGTTGAEARCAEQTLAALGLSFVGPDDTFGVSDGQRAQAVAAQPTAWSPTGSSARSSAPASASGCARRHLRPRPRPRRPRRRRWRRRPRRPMRHQPTPAAGAASCSHGPRSGCWAVESDGTVARTYRVSGRTREPYAGTYQVYSRSMYTYAAGNPSVKMRYMVRFAYGPGGGRIGFHEIPTRNGVPLQTRGPARSAAVRWLHPPEDVRRPVDVGLGRRRHDRRRALRAFRRRSLGGSELRRPRRPSPSEARRRTISLCCVELRAAEGQPADDVGAGRLDGPGQLVEARCPG